MRFWKKPSFYRGLVAVMFIVAGAVHLLWPAIYVHAMPPYIPYPMAMILVSGCFELAGGVGILIPRTRRFAGFGLLLLLLAVFPVNIHMFLERWHKGSIDMTLLLLFLRLPLQAEFIRWVWRAFHEPKATLELMRNNTESELIQRPCRGAGQCSRIPGVALALLA